MSLSTIAQLVFFTTVGLLFLFADGSSRVLSVIAGVAALVVAVLMVTGENSVR